MRNIKIDSVLSTFYSTHQPSFVNSNKLCRNCSYIVCWATKVDSFSSSMLPALVQISSSNIHPDLSAKIMSTRHMSINQFLMSLHNFFGTKRLICSIFCLFQSTNLSLIFLWKKEQEKNVLNLCNRFMIYESGT